MEDTLKLNCNSTVTVTVTVTVTHNAFMEHGGKDERKIFWNSGLNALARTSNRIVHARVRVTACTA